MREKQQKGQSVKAVRPKSAPQGTEVRSDSGVLQRSLSLLSILAESTHPMTSRDLAAVTHLHESTVHRLLQALCDIGYVGKSDSRRYFALGKAFLPLTAYHPLNSLRRDSYESLHQLREIYGLTSSLLVFIGSDRMLLEFAGAPGTLTPYYSTHLENPLHGSAAGKLILQRMSAEERTAVLGPPPYPAVTPATITTEKALQEDLDRVAARGYSTSIDENFVGMSAITAPIYAGPEQMVGCIALVGASSKFTDARVQEMAVGLKSRAQLISIGSSAVRAVRGMFA